MTKKINKQRLEIFVYKNTLYALLLFVLIFGLSEWVNAHTCSGVAGETCSCGGTGNADNDCMDCTNALNDAGSGAIVQLAMNITNKLGTCINNPANFNNKIFDCQEYKIDGNLTAYGIYLMNKSNNTIYNCVIVGFRHGIYMVESSNNILINNIVNANVLGIYLLFSSPNNTLINNTLTNNIVGGIYLLASSSNTVTKNILYNNTVHGIVLSQSLDNNLTYNQIEYNKGNGIDIFVSNRNIIWENNISGNHQHGISLVLSPTNAIVRNTIVNQEGPNPNQENPPPFLSFGVFEWTSGITPTTQQQDYPLAVFPPGLGNMIDNNWKNYSCEASRLGHISYNPPPPRPPPKYRNWCLLGIHINGFPPPAWPPPNPPLNPLNPPPNIDLKKILWELRGNCSFSIDENGSLYDASVPICISNKTTTNTSANYSIASNITSNLSLAVFEYACPSGYTCSITYTPKNGVSITPNCTYDSGYIICYDLPIEISNESNILGIDCDPPRAVPSFTPIGILILIILVLLFGIVSIKKRYRPI